MDQIIQEGSFATLKYETLLICKYYYDRKSFLICEDPPNRSGILKFPENPDIVAGRKFTLPCRMHPMNITSDEMEGWFISEAHKYNGDVPYGTTLYTRVGRKRYEIRKGDNFDDDGEYYLIPYNWGRYEDDVIIKKAKPIMRSTGQWFVGSTFSSHEFKFYIDGLFLANYNVQTTTFSNITKIKKFDLSKNNKRAYARIVDKNGMFFRISVKHLKKIQI